MSLDNIQLTPSVIQGLYSKSLYDLSNTKTTLDDKQQGEISYLGNNQKKVAVLVNSPEAIYLPDDELNFLLGILTACKLSMADIALINMVKNPKLNYNIITEQLKAEKVFLFGLDTNSIELPLQFPHYQVQKYNNQIYLSSLSLANLQTDKAEKMKLWNCLKTIFSL